MRGIRLYVAVFSGKENVRNFYLHGGVKTMFPDDVLKIAAAEWVEADADPGFIWDRLVIYKNGLTQSGMEVTR